MKDIKFPLGYNWIIKQKIVGYEEFTQLQPWYFLPKDKCFWVNDKWQSENNENLFVFARRQDNDDLVCFKILDDNEVDCLYLIHGWTNNGYEIVKIFPDFWSWFHFVIQDIAEWIKLNN
jgi:hypothetical protein